LKYYSSVVPTNSRPTLAASCIHAGAGQQTFGFSSSQKADLMVAYTNLVPAVLSYHNYHGHMWHYTGHFEDCPLATSSCRPRILETTRRLDDFRMKLAQAWTEIRPDKCIFDYSVSYSCQMFHGSKVASTKNDSAHTSFYSVKECLWEERRDEAWFPPSEQYLELDALKKGIKEGAFTGFVVLKGGKESDRMKFLDPAGSRFGFCVQQYAPTSSQISEFTKQQIGSYFKMNEKEVEAYIARQPSRTINSGTFHSEETVSTTYLHWLMNEREFDDFDITHFIAYQFRDWNKDFLEPVLQKRHECKLAGLGVAAECLKLIGNGSYGYNGLESCNYDTVKLMTQETLNRALAPSGRLSHVKVKNISLIGMIKLEEKSTKKSLKSNSKKPAQRKNLFEDGEAAEVGSDYDDDDDGQEDNFSAPIDAFNENLDIDAEEEERDTEDDEEHDDESHLKIRHYKAWRSELFGSLFEKRCNATPISSLLLSCDKSKKLQKTSNEEVSSDSDLDLEEELVREAEEANDSKIAAAHADRIALEHSYAAKNVSKVSNKNCDYTYHFLYSVTISGEHKKISNCLPKAVSILSNSKRLFLGHLSCMFKCLDPCLAELSYIDTDSCIWSLSSSDLKQCLRKSRLNLWNEANILADETAPTSCHGKMKLEGIFSAGQFKSMKIYRLYQLPAPSSQSSDNNSNTESLVAAYTRCKGVNRYLATKLPDAGFSSFDPVPIVVHRNALKPSKKGEMFVCHESRSVSVPFNLKRYVTSDGYHTLPFSLFDK